MTARGGHRHRRQAAEIHGIGRSLGEAWPPVAVDDPAMRAAISRVDGEYRPDAAADARFDQLLERLKLLPWDERRQG